MRLRAVRAPLVGTVPIMRLYSEARTNYDGTSASPWPAPGEKPRYPSALSEFPLPKPRMRKTHIEWSFFHGHGGRLGKYGPSREIADFEFADGTPASIGPRRFAYKHHQDHLLVQMIRAGAAVERHEASGLLPRIPGTVEQRNWDPAIPVFLEDVDEHGSPPAPVGDIRSRAIDEKMQSMTARAPNDVANRHKGEELEANTMFAPIDPNAFVSDHVSIKEDRRPYWSRRRWALTESFLVPKSPKPKNTIKDE